MNARLLEFKKQLFFYSLATSSKRHSLTDQITDQITDHSITDRSFKSHSLTDYFEGNDARFTSHK